MNIAYITWVFPVLSQTFVDNQILALKRAGWKVMILPMRPGKDVIQSEISRLLVNDTLHCPKLWSPRFWGALFRLFTARPLAVVRSIFLLREWTWWPGALARLVYLLPRILYFGEQCRARGIEHIHADFLGLHAVAARMIADALNISYSARVHTARDGGSARSVRLFTKGVSFIVCDGRATLEALVARLPADSEVHVFIARQAVDFDRFVELPVVSEDAQTVLAIGRLYPKKGLEYLIEATRLLRAAGKQNPCIIVGNGPERCRLQALIDHTQLTDVSLVGPHPYESLPGFLRRAAVLVMPSISTETDEDGLPTVILEAMAAGRPVVATNVGVIPEAVLDGETGYLVPQRDPQALADALARLLDSASLRQQMGQKARAYVTSEFSPQRSNRLLMEAIEQAVASHHITERGTGAGRS